MEGTTPMLRRGFLCAWMMLCGCGGEMPERPAPLEPVDRAAATFYLSAASTCEDGDGDGYGAHCAAGADCDDQDPAVGPCVDRCAAPSPGCSCDEGAGPVACDVDSQGQVTPLTCWIGQRDCAEGRWGPCRAYAPRFRNP